MLPHISAQMFTGADKSIRASTVADEHCGSLSWREGCRWTKSPATSRGATMFRIASPLPRPPILAALIVVGLYLSAASPAEAVEPRSEEHTSELQSLMRISY